MSRDPYAILDDLRTGSQLAPADLRAFADGATTGRWTDAQIGAFLMGCTQRPLGRELTRELTLAMLESGDRWSLSDDVGGLGDKHSTGGVGDKVSLVLGPLMADAGHPMVMLTGRALGHTGGTADKLEAIPGLSLDLDRERALTTLRATGLAVGAPNASIAPADRVVYRLRDETATIDCTALITASILSKKLATGAEAIVFDVKSGRAAFRCEPEAARALAQSLVDTSTELGMRAVARTSDMSQPLGRAVGHEHEVGEALATLGGDGPEDLVELSCVLASDLATLLGSDETPADFRRRLESGEPRERFLRWAAAQGADRSWTARPRFAPSREQVVRADRNGSLRSVDAKRLGQLLGQAARGPDGSIDHRVGLTTKRRLGDLVVAGEALAILSTPVDHPGLDRKIGRCFEIAEGADTDRPLPFSDPIHPSVAPISRG